MERRIMWIALVLVLAACAPTAPVTVGELLPAGETPQLSEPAPSPDPETAVPESTPVPLIARVNGEPILVEEFERQMARYETSMLANGEDPATPEGQANLAEARETVLEWMIEQRLMLQAAAEAGIAVDATEVEAAIQSLSADIGAEELENRLREEGLNLDELREELTAQMIVSQMAEQVASTVPERDVHVNARHIVVGTEEEARRLLTQIQAGADFAALARAYSLDAFTRERGGDLGYFPPGILTAPEVEEVAFQLQPGQVSDVIPSSLGYHVIQVVDRVEEMETDAENLRLLREEAVRRWIESLWETAEIERFLEPAD